MRVSVGLSPLVSWRAAMLHKECPANEQLQKVIDFEEPG
jgi:hypothetical protein